MQQRQRKHSSYSYNEVYCSPINVPFSWEYKPGLSKLTHQRSNKDSIGHATQFVLSPPPSSLSGPHRFAAFDDKHNSLILCAVHPITSFRRETQKEDDPFLEAYKNCTRSPLQLTRSTAAKRTFIRSIVRKYMHILSCHSGHVRT